MFDSVPQNQPNRQSRAKPSLIFLILILGVLSAVGVGIMVVDLIKDLQPKVFAAPGIYKTLNYQGKLQDLDGITVPDAAYNIKFTIYDAPAAGNVLWTARESDACGAPFNPAAKSVTTSVGVFSTQLGESGDCPLNLDFNDDSYYLGITVGSDAEMTPRKRIGAAGYAFNADLLDGLSTSAVGGASAFVPATDASGNLVLTGNVTFDTTTFALDSTNDNIGIGTATPDISRTLDLTTAKQYGIYVETSLDTAHPAGVAVYGAATATTNAEKAGGYFTAAGAAGRGVFGEASETGNPMNPNYGGYFTSAGDYGQGVYGEATASGLGTVNVGGYFTAAGDNGYGVWAVASGTAGINYGGYFLSNGLGGYAVKGWATDTNAATNYGGYFQASGETGIAVYGLASGTAGINYGGSFQANGPGGYGVYGWAADTSAVANYGGYFQASGTAASTYGVYGAATGAGAFTNYGGYFTAAGDTARAVFGNATASGANDNYGGYFLAAGAGWEATGVYGAASGTSTVRGVYGGALSTAAVTNYGGFFQAQGETGRGVFAEANNSAAATNYGGYFAASGTGFGTSGVYGQGSATGAVTNFGGGFLAQGQSGRGVYGEANATGAVTNYGGYFTAAGDTAIAVYGTASATGAVVNYGGQFYAYGQNGRGVYGQAATTGAFINYGGVFEALGDLGVGVSGTASATGAFTNYGGYFTAAGTTGRAVYGEASDLTSINFGGYFIARGADGGTSGVYGEATAAGSVSGVFGFASSSGAVANYGVYGAADGTGGARGVFGFASNVSGTNYGVYGKVASSSGWAGYFTDGNGLYASRFSIADTTSAIAYNTIGAPPASHVAAGEIEDASDLFIADDLEVNGQSWFDGGHVDLAEMVAYSGEGEAGDVVVIDENNDNAAKLATKPYDQSVLGIISTKPSLIITGDIKEGKLLAVAGRVPTKVTNANGAIKRGDLLTTSSVPGRAMKATEPGPIVGKAMGECDERECTIWVFLNVSWYGGVKTEVATTVSPTTEDTEDLDRDSILDKVTDFWKKVVSWIKK